MSTLHLKELFERMRSITSKKTRAVSPCVGIEYNKIIDVWKISTGIYSVDMARSPNVISGDFVFKDVNAEVRKINNHRGYVDYQRRRCKGRSL